MIKKTLLSFLVTTSVFAGGDNRVTMTDIKEALYNLVLTSEKNEINVNDMKMRVSKIETMTPLIDRNTQNLSTLMEKLNTLGVQVNPEGDKTIALEIANFVEQNNQYLPYSAQRVK